MSFANSATALLEWCVVVKFPTEPPTTTVIDVYEEGDIPILISLQQMMNLGFTLRLDPNAVYLTSKVLGYQDERLPFSTSKHVLIDLAKIQGNIKARTGKSFKIILEHTFLR